MSALLEGRVITGGRRCSAWPLSNRSTESEQPALLVTGKLIMGTSRLEASFFRQCLLKMTISVSADNPLLAAIFRMTESHLKGAHVCI